MTNSLIKTRKMDTPNFDLMQPKSNKNVLNNRESPKMTGQMFS